MKWLLLASLTKVTVNGKPCTPEGSVSASASWISDANIHLQRTMCVTDQQALVESGSPAKPRQLYAHLSITNIPGCEYRCADLVKYLQRMISLWSAFLYNSGSKLHGVVHHTLSIVHLKHAIKLTLTTEIQTYMRMRCGLCYKWLLL